MRATTGDRGAYRFENVPAGSGELTFRLLDFGTLRQSVVIAEGGSVTADQRPGSRLGIALVRAG
jgi:hypothetical protein